MTIAELRALLAATTARVGALPWTASDPANISQVAVAEVFNALPLLLDIADSIHVCREHGFDCGGYGVWLHDHQKARAALKTLMIPNGNTKVMKIFDHTRGA